MRIRQIVIAVHDLVAGRAVLAGLLPLGQPFRDPGVAEFGIDNAVFGFGDQFIEVISPTRPDTACGRHLARHGDSGYMLILQTDDFAREQARWAALNVRTVWSARHSDIVAAHLHPKDVGGAIVSVDQPQPASAWRWGGPDWSAQPGRLGAQRVRAIRLRSADPQALAERWALVFGLPTPTRTDDGWQLALDGGHVDVVDAARRHDARAADAPAAAARSSDAITGFTLAVADPDAVLAAARAAGLAQAGGSVEVLGARLQIEPL